LLGLSSEYVVGAITRPRVRTEGPHPRRSRDTIIRFARRSFQVDGGVARGGGGDTAAAPQRNDHNHIADKSRHDGEPSQCIHRNVARRRALTCNGPVPVTAQCQLTTRFFDPDATQWILRPKHRRQARKPESVALVPIGDSAIHRPGDDGEVAMVDAARRAKLLRDLEQPFLPDYDAQSMPSADKRAA
jgi:hypothetical protein